MQKTTLKHEIRNESCKINYPLSVILSILLYFVYVYLLTFSSLSRKTDGFLGLINQSNYIKYFLGLALFAIALLGCIVLFRFLPRVGNRLNVTSSNKIKYTVFGGLILTVTAYLTTYVFYTEQNGTVFGAFPETFPWHLIPTPVAIAVPAIFAMWCVWTLVRGRDLGQFTTYAFYALAMLLTYYGLLYYNLCDIHHGGAYIETIFNAYHGTPFNFATTGIYGHYGIFFAPLLKILGGTPKALFSLIALTGVLATVALIYIVECLVSKRLLRVLAVYGSILTITAMRNSNYWQLQPHRILFPLLMLAYLTAMIKKEAFGLPRIISGFGLCAAAIVWNTETGLFCTVAFSLALIVHEWQAIQSNKHMWLKCGALLAGIPFATAVAILFVNLYNIICGGEWIFKLFFFPFFESDYMDGTLKADLPSGVQIWPLVMILFMLMIACALYHTNLVRREQHCAHAPIWLALGTVALLNCSYYVNRAAYYNLDICLQLATLGMTLLADRYLPELAGLFSEKKSIAKTACSALCFCLIVVLSVLTVHVGYAPVAMTERAEAGCYDSDFFDEKAAELEALVPEDYLLVGTGSCVLQLELKRDPLRCYRDFSNLYVGGNAAAEQILRDAREIGKIAFYMSTEKEWALLDMFLAQGNCRLVSSGTVGNTLVYCYKCE